MHQHTIVFAGFIREVILLAIRDDLLFYRFIYSISFCFLLFGRKKAELKNYCVWGKRTLPSEIKREKRNREKQKQKENLFCIPL